jgi:hypothetical protein
LTKGYADVLDDEVRAALKQGEMYEMPAIQHTAYPRLQSSYTSADLMRLFTPTTDERMMARRVTTGETAPIGFLVLLKTFQLLGYFLPLRSVPHVIVQHIAQQLKTTPGSVALDRYDASGTRRRHIAIIRDYLHVQPYDHRARRRVIRTIAAAAAAKEDLADLVNVGIAELVNLRYELPGYTTLEKIALYASAAARTRDDLAEMLVKRVQQFHKQSKEALIWRMPATITTHFCGHASKAIAP